MTKVKPEDLVLVVRSMRDVMSEGDAWTWDEIESFLAGSLTWYGDVASIIEMLRGAAVPTVEQRLRSMERMNQVATARTYHD